MDKIRKLDAHLTNMIAAGEVVERPQGVVKELVENSLDAQATQVEITIEEGGMRLIEIVDNGEGMSRHDAVMAFQRHATSKIKEINDLWAIDTLGFRGEALPSIASVSQVELITHNGTDHTRLEVAFGDIVKQEVYPHNRGTTIRVSNLFYKTPARLKHLKSLQYETSLVSSVVEKFALSHPEIAFKLVADGKVLLHTLGSGKIIDVMQAVFGLEIAQSAINFAFYDFDYQVKGAFVLPRINRANRYYILIFINGRMVRSTRLTNAIIQAYGPYLPNTRYPIVVIDITMDPRLVDVNVHPAKWDIRLAKEMQLENLIRDNLNSLIRQAMQAPEVVFKPEKETIVMPTLDLNPPINVGQPTMIIQEPTVSYDTVKEETAVATKPARQQEPVNNVQSEPTEKPKPVFPQMEVIGQLHGKYILCEAEEGLYIIDQHAAEERTNYERFNRQFNQNKKEYIELLVPLKVDVPLRYQARIDEIMRQFNQLQIRVELFDNSLLCREIPLWMQAVDLAAFIQEMMEIIIDNLTVDFSQLQKKAIATMACHASIRFNRNLSKDEMRQVVINLSQCEQPFHCPHGRPTFILISENQLIKEFYR